MSPAGERGPAEAGDDVGLGEFAPFEVAHVGFGERLVEVAERVEHLLSPEFGVGHQVFGDLGLGDGRAEVLGLVIEGLHRHEVDQPLELAHRPFGPGSDGDLDGDRVAFEPFG